MKVYMDELPEGCAECPCLNKDSEHGFGCNLVDEGIPLSSFLDGKKSTMCPLQKVPTGSKWEELKSWLKKEARRYNAKAEQSGYYGDYERNLNYRDMLVEILNKLEELER